MISLDAEGISPSSHFIPSMDFLLFSTRSCYSNIICTMGQISFMELEIYVQIFSLASANVLPTTVCFLSCCISFLIFFDTCLSIFYLVWKADLSSWRFSTSIFSLLIYVPCRVVSSMAFARSTVFSNDINGVSDRISTVVVIHMDIGGHPPFPTGSKQFSDNFGNLLFLAVLTFGAILRA
jgi:hypothetical protein